MKYLELKILFSLISFATTSGFATQTLARTWDYLLWYAKKIKAIKYRPLFIEKDVSFESGMITAGLCCQMERRETYKGITRRRANIPT